MFKFYIQLTILQLFIFVHSFDLNPGYKYMLYVLQWDSCLD